MHAQDVPNLVLNLEGHRWVGPQKLASVVLALPDALAVVAVPGAGFLDELCGYAQVDDFAFARDAFAIEDVEFGLAERRRHLVLDDLDLGLGCR